MWLLGGSCQTYWRMKSNTKRLEKAKNPVLEEHPSVDGIFSSV